MAIDHRPVVAASEQGSREETARLISLGRLAARVAHELNNPLDGALRFIGLAMRCGGSESGRPDEYLLEARAGLLRVKRIVGDLLEYARGAGQQPALQELGEVVRLAVRDGVGVQHVPGLDIEVDCAHAELPPFPGDRLYHVLINLVRNAVDAMPGGGRLRVGTRTESKDVVIEVVDSGPGLPDPPERVFVPFYTTKPAGRGSGLGLAICRDLVQALGGSITGSSRKSGGAVFTVRLPLVTLEQRSGATAVISSSGRGR